MKRNKVIVVSGIPGTGKTTIAKRIAAESGYTNLDEKSVIKKFGLGESYDKKRKCVIVDIKKFIAALIKIIKKSAKPLVIDSHLAHFLPKKYVDCCFVCTCNLRILKKRLLKRAYSKKKIRENLDAEIFETCFLEATEQGHHVILIDTTKL